MNNSVHYETAWRFLKSIIEQFKESQMQAMMGDE